MTHADGPGSIVQLFTKTGRSGTIIRGNAGMMTQGLYDAAHEPALGATARSVEPLIKQVFIGRGEGVADPAHFERKLYVIRKLFEKAVAALDIPENKFAYVPSLSSRTLIYKGMLSADQIAPMYPDLVDPDVESALALVHQRFSTNTFPSWPLAHPYRYIAHNGEINTLRR